MLHIQTSAISMITSMSISMSRSRTGAGIGAGAGAEAGTKADTGGYRRIQGSLFKKNISIFVCVLGVKNNFL